MCWSGKFQCRSIFHNISIATPEILVARSLSRVPVVLPACSSNPIESWASTHTHKYSHKQLIKSKPCPDWDCAKRGKREKLEQINHRLALGPSHLNIRGLVCFGTSCSQRINKIYDFALTPEAMVAVMMMVPNESSIRFGGQATATDHRESMCHTGSRWMEPRWLHPSSHSFIHWPPL